MANDFFRGTSIELRVCFFAFMVDLAGGLLAALGVAVDSKVISLVGYVICVLAVVTGFGAIILGWLRIAAKVLKTITLFLKKKCR